MHHFSNRGQCVFAEQWSSPWVPRCGKLSSAKNRKDTRKQFLSFNSASSVTLTTDAIFFFWWKLLKEKPETRSLSWGDAQRKCGQNKRQNAQSPRHPVHHATQICPVLYQLSGPFTDASCLEIRVHDRLYQCWDSFCTISVHFEYFLDSKAAWSKLWNKICM